MCCRGRQRMLVFRLMHKVDQFENGDAPLDEDQDKNRDFFLLRSIQIFRFDSIAKD